MKQSLTKSLFFIVFAFTLIASSQSYAQTIVQWYTSMGDFRAQLREDLVPMTGQNFIDLTNENFYDDLIFHRVIEGFMIQDGCPDGTGYGGPGYSFDDEFHPDLRHDEPGILSMANSGPNTNGSQYFITLAPTAWLDDAHAVFGKIIDGMEVVYAIGSVETNSNDKPLVDVVIDSIRVVTGDAMIELTSPVAGGKYNSAGVNDITWNSAFIADVKIEFSSDNGSTWEDIIESTSANTRSFEWNTPDIISDQCFIKISDASDPDNYSMNEEAFTIASLELLGPNGFDIYQVGRETEVTWNAELLGELTLYYQASEGGEWVMVTEGINAEDGSYMWTPEVASNWCRLKLEESDYPELFDVSDNRFFVYLLDVLTPSGYDPIPGYSVYDITWDSEILSNVKIELSLDNGENWSVLEASMPADEQVYAWTVPNVYGDLCFIKLSDPSNPQIYSTSACFYIHIVESVEELSVQQIGLFPNPVKDFLSIQWQGHIRGNEEIILDIYNANGQLVLTQDVDTEQLRNEQLIINTQDFPQGVYFVNVNIAGEDQSVKFIKM